MVSTTANPDSELFCTVSSTHKVPERHPSTLIPGGHASPLRHPTVLRPGAGKNHARKSSSETPNTPAQHHQRSPSATPQPTYKAYSPPATPQDPRASVVAGEIEDFFTALDIQPLQIKKQDTISSPSTTGSGRASPDIQRCASPPLPPKVKLEEPQQLSPPAELSSLSEPEANVQDDESDSDQPPAYDESECVQAPPEKPTATGTQESESQESESEEAARSPTLAGSAAMSATKVGGSVAGVDTDEAAAKDTVEEAKPDTEEKTEESEATPAQQPQQESQPASPADTDSPPPLPPRPAASASTSPQPDTAAQMMPGAFPPPPRRSQSPKGHSSSSSYSKMTYIPGAAATSATAVGAAVAIPSSDFAHGGLTHARKALGQRVSNLIDKAKEHHEARKSAAVTRGPAQDGKKDSVLVVAPMIGA
ncbi:hypothetical protein KVR01_006370 [Diaporthe batatas]|uniref:uncharacterized protein n=1 Tax=Diaporthe batatas TaxID=748121 RepID=UPI001D04E983|nr:uncharacterized protein KVR01_006370 [Diaporthe batatas]KAG8164452.1 hypothetical protein KVR01_006370 [Diaporthe batatas]